MCPDKIYWPKNGEAPKWTCLYSVTLFTTTRQNSILTISLACKFLLWILFYVLNVTMHLGTCNSKAFMAFFFSPLGYDFTLYAVKQYLVTMDSDTYCFESYLAYIFLTSKFVLNHFVVFFVFYSVIS